MTIINRFSIFIAVGIASALIDIGLMQYLISHGTNYLAATSLGFLVGLIANFSLHTHVTFNSGYSHRVLFRFAIVVLVNYMTTLLTVHLFQVTLNMSLLGKLISLPIVAINGFLLSKYWVYN